MLHAICSETEIPFAFKMGEFYLFASQIHNKNSDTQTFCQLKE
jgi:hypothetical protein